MSTYSQRQDLSEHVFKSSTRGQELARLDDPDFSTVYPSSYSSPTSAYSSKFGGTTSTYDDFEGRNEMGMTRTQTVATSTGAKPIVTTRQIDPNTTVTTAIFPSTDSNETSYESTTIISTSPHSPYLQRRTSKSPKSGKSRSPKSGKSRSPKSRSSKSPKQHYSPHVSQRAFEDSETETIELTTTIHIPDSGGYASSSPYTSTSSSPYSSTSAYSSPSAYSSSSSSPYSSSSSSPYSNTSSSYSSYSSSSSRSSPTYHSPTRAIQPYSPTRRSPSHAIDSYSSSQRSPTRSYPASGTYAAPRDDDVDSSSEVDDGSFQVTTTVTIDM